MIAKQVIIDKIEVTEHGHIQVRTATRIVEDGVLLSETYHRYCLSPGDDLTGQDPRVESIAKAVWNK